MPPRFFKQVLLISQFELKRDFATRKGLLSVVTFGVVWHFILLYPLRFVADLLAQGKDLQQDSSFLCNGLIKPDTSKGRFIMSLGVEK